MPPANAPAPERSTSLDAFRGCVIVTMIWVNYLPGMPGIAFWLEHAGPR
jgi:predicted acyltransferase